MFAKEKSSGRSVLVNASWLSKFVNEIGVADFGFCGNIYTWSNQRVGLVNVH